jgi:hypothetical protein
MSAMVVVDRVEASNIRTIPSALELLFVVGAHAPVRRMASSIIMILMYATASVSVSTSAMVEWICFVESEEIRDSALALVVEVY